MPLPRDRFFVAWESTPWEPNPVWTDCTPWLLSVGRERGRQPRDAVNRASRLTARLDNRDGRFSMQNPSSPYYPNVEPRRPCMWTTDWNGVIHYRFEGLLDTLPTEWTGFADEVATYTALGRLANLAEVDLPGSVWETTIRNTAPKHWWRMDDPEPAATLDDAGSAGEDMGVNGPTTRVEGATMIPGSARRMDPVTAYAGKYGPSDIAGSQSWTVSAVCKLDLTRPSQVGVHKTYPISAHGTTAPIPFEVVHTNSVDATGFWENRINVILRGNVLFNFTITFVSNAPPYQIFFPAQIRADWFVVTIVRDQTGVVVYIDDTIVAPAATSVTLPSPTVLVMGTIGVTEAEPTELDEVVGWNRAITATEAVAVNNAMVKPWFGDSVNARFDRVVAAANLPASRMSRGANSTAVLGRTQLGGKALTYFHRLARAARGRMLDTVDGNIVLRSGADLAAMRASRATFGNRPATPGSPASPASPSTQLLTESGDTVTTESGDPIMTEDWPGAPAGPPVPGDMPYQSVSTDASYQNVVTVVRAKNVEGNVQEAVATDLVPGTGMSYVDRFGRRGPTDGELGDLMFSTDAQALEYAQWVVRNGKDPKVALDPLVLHPLGDDAVTGTVLTLDIDDVVTVKRKHPAQTQTLTAVCRIAGITETVSMTGRRRTWSVEWRLEPLEVS